MTKKENIKDAISRIDGEIGTGFKKTQEHIVCDDTERALIIKLKRRLGISKPRALAIAAQHLLEQLGPEKRSDAKE